MSKRARSLLLVAVGVVYTGIAYAVDVVPRNVYVTDALEGAGAKLLKGRTLTVYCRYEYTGQINLPMPPWQVRLEVDGKPIAVPTAVPPAPPYPGFDPQTMSKKYPSQIFEVSANWMAATAGQHKAVCVLDPDGKLKAAENAVAVKNNTRSTTFMVDVVGVIHAGSSQAGGPNATAPAALPALPPALKGPAPAANVPVAPNATPVIPDPDLTFALRAQPLHNCAAGQEVVRVSGTIRNIGAGHAVIPAGAPIVKIESTVGVYGNTISVGNLAPGQSQPVTVTLKAKGTPASLAGATLVLSAWLNQGVGIKESSYANSHQTLTVVFPANFCSAPAARTLPQRSVAPSRVLPAQR